MNGFEKFKLGWVYLPLGCTLWGIIAFALLVVGAAYGVFFFPFSAATADRRAFPGCAFSDAAPDPVALCDFAFELSPSEGRCGPALCHPYGQFDSPRSRQFSDGILVCFPICTARFGDGSILYDFPDPAGTAP